MEPSLILVVSQSSERSILRVPVIHARILRAVWRPNYRDEPDYLRVYVKNHRKKIEDDPAHPEDILTEPWFGYRFGDPFAGESLT